MSTLILLHKARAPHAVMNNDTFGVSDWFAVCPKSSMRNVIITNQGVYEVSRINLYIFTLSKKDIHAFYELQRSGLYTGRIVLPEGDVWEYAPNALKGYIKSIKLRRKKTP